MRTKTSIPDLGQRIRSARATTISLAQAAGCAPDTVMRMRRGEAVTPAIAEAVLQALGTRRFERAPQGAK